MSDRRPLLAALVLSVVTVVAYLPVFGNDFVNYDDDLYVTGVEQVRAGLGADGLAWAFTSFQGANWFPLTRLSWMLDAELHGLEPSGFHATSLLLHVAAALALFAALRRLTGAWAPSAFAAAVFALHPLHVESVAWVATRKDVLSGLWFALALWAYARQAEGVRPWAWGSAVFAAMALGLMAKPMLVTLPCVLLLLDLWPLRRVTDAQGGLDPGRLGRMALQKLPLFALAAAASVVTFVAQREGGALQALERFPLAVRAQAAVDAYAIYLGKTFWPTGLAVFHPHPSDGLPLWRTGLAAGLLILASAWAWRERRARPWWLVGWLWFLGMLVPVIGLVQVGEAAYAERYTYLPQIGLALAVGWAGWQRVRARPALSRPVAAAALVALALLALLTTAQARVWRDSRSLFAHALRVTSGNQVAHINLGVALARAGELEEAAAQLDAALLLAPRSSHAWGVRGEVRLAQGRPDEALADLRRAVALDPEAARWRISLARVHRAAERWAPAELQLRAALARDPARADAHALLGVVLAERGRPEAALASFDEALRLDPGLEEALARRALLLEEQGREAEAIAAWRAALARGGRSASALNNLAWLLATARAAALREPDEAVALASEAAELSRRRDPRILDTLATALLAADRSEEAAALARRALALAEADGDAALAGSLRRRFALP